MPFKFIDVSRYATGTYAEDEGTVTCSKCEAGYFLPTEKASSRLQCRKCVPGTRSGEGAGGCFLCPPGQYGDQEAMAECFMCPPGTFNPSAAWGGRLDHSCWFVSLKQKNRFAQIVRLINRANAELLARLSTRSVIGGVGLKSDERKA